MSVGRVANPGGREELMRRVRAALGRREGDAGVVCPAPPEVDESLVRLVGPEEGMVEGFIARAGAAGMKTHRCGEGSLRETLANVLRAEGVRSFCVGLPAGRMIEAARAGGRDAGAEMVDYRSLPGLQAQFEVDAGITDVVAAIAESGTLVVRSDAVRSRGAFIVPPVHIAIVPADSVLPDLMDLWRLDGLGGEESGPAAPTSLVLVSGPSKTADIEGILITGVHGPRDVHVVVVGGVSAEC
jgi:L-lactate dehydrogenase complex protein LldG